MYNGEEIKENQAARKLNILKGFSEVQELQKGEYLKADWDGKAIPQDEDDDKLEIKDGEKFDTHTTNLPEIKKGKVEMDEKEFVAEHKNLVNVLESPSHADDKREAKKQAEELSEIKKAKSSSPFLSVDDFDGKRLNKSFFTNIAKGISEDQFMLQYPESDFNVFEKATVEGYIREVYERTGGEIVKGSFNDTPEVAAVLENMRNQVSLLKAVSVETEKGDIVNVFVMPIEKAKETKEFKEGVEEENKDEDQLEKNCNYSMKKGEGDDEEGDDEGKQIEKAKSDEIGGDSEDDEIEKGVIHDTVNYGNIDLNFSKTGAEIKEKLEGILQKEQAELNTTEMKLKLMEADQVYPPTELPYGSDDKTYNTYRWEMTYLPENNRTIQLSPTEQGTLSKEECDTHRLWNDLVYKYRNCKKEIDTINLLQRNLDDKKSYKLTARQMLDFGF